MRSFILVREKSLNWYLPFYVPVSGPFCERYFQENSIVYVLSFEK